MNEIQTKIQKSSKIIYNIIKIFRIVAIVVSAILLAGLIWDVAVPESVANVNLGKIQLLAPFTPVGKSGGELMAVFASGLISNGLIIAVLCFAEALFKDISIEYTPFSEKHSKRIRIIALLMFANAIVVPPIEMLFTMIFAPTATATASIELNNIVVVAIFSFLVMIFDYGRMLQQQSDETL